jgi:hypothetical protein
MVVAAAAVAAARMAPVAVRAAAVDRATDRAPFAR